MNRDLRQPDGYFSLLDLGYHPGHSNSKQSLKLALLLYVKRPTNKTYSLTLEPLIIFPQPLAEIKDGSKEGEGGEYQVYPMRWIILAMFVLYSASNAFQWTQLVRQSFNDL